MRAAHPGFTARFAVVILGLWMAGCATSSAPVPEPEASRAAEAKAERKPTATRSEIDTERTRRALGSDPADSASREPGDGPAEPRGGAPREPRAPDPNADDTSSAIGLQREPPRRLPERPIGLGLANDPPHPARIVTAIEEERREAIAGIEILNDEPFPDMFFRRFGVNPTIDTEEQRFSTFSVDVDSASYTLARSYLLRGAMVPEEAVRIEEFVNAQDYAYPPPRRDDFSLHAEAFPSPHRPGYHVLHLGIKAREISRRERAPANLVFVIDVSGSMDRENRLGLVKRSLRYLVDALREDDRVGIVAYGTDARVVLYPTSGARRRQILHAIDRLVPSGSTNAQAGIELGYALLHDVRRRGDINRIVLCSDGVANTGLATDAEGILDRVPPHEREGVSISTVGFGMGNYSDALMERLAEISDGNYAYVDGEIEARRIFEEKLTGTLQVVAKDAKIQVEFDEAAVSRYRLIGYENRALARRGFDDDRVDAGEVGAGHTVTALYEVKLRDGARDLGWLRIRYKAPWGGASRLVEKRIPAEVIRVAFEQASAPARLSLVAATFAEKLRGSYWVRDVDYAAIATLLDDLPQSLKRREPVAKLRDLIDRAARLDRRTDRFSGVSHDGDFDRVPILE